MGTERILIADDDPRLRNLIALVVRRLGFEVDIAADGEEALRKLNSADYCVIVLDLMMPRVNGYEVIARMRQEGHRPAVVVVTAMETARFLQMDPDIVTTVVRKPFDIELLGAVVAEAASVILAQRASGRDENDGADHVIQFPRR